MNCARNCENLLNFVKVIPKTLLVPFFSGHGVECTCVFNAVVCMFICAMLVDPNLLLPSFAGQALSANIRCKPEMVERLAG